MGSTLPTSVSCVVSSILCLITFAGMQLFKTQLGSSKVMTILGGFLGSNLFILALTAMNNFETMNFGRNFHAKLFPEECTSIALMAYLTTGHAIVHVFFYGKYLPVISCLLLAMVASGMVHRVCVTTCFIFSCVALYYVNKLSQSKYAVTAPAPKGKKNN